MLSLTIKALSIFTIFHTIGPLAMKGIHAVRLIVQNLRNKSLRLYFYMIHRAKSGYSRPCLHYLYDSSYIIARNAHMRLAFVGNIVQYAFSFTTSLIRVQLLRLLICVLLYSITIYALLKDSHTWV